MKRRRKILCAFLCVLLVSLLGGCGTTFDASGYLKALLDNSYKNDSTAFVEMKIGSANEAAALYEQGIDAEVAAMGLSGDIGLTEEEMMLSREVFSKMLAGARYTVGDAVLQENKDYVVTVTYEQMNVYAPTMELYLEKMAELNTKWEDQPPTETERVKEILMTVITCMDEALALATYDEPATTTVRVELTNNVYYPNDEDLVKLEMVLFDTDAMSGDAEADEAGIKSMD